MSTVNMYLGAKSKIATVTVLDTNGAVVPPNQYSASFVEDTPNIVSDSATTYGNRQFGAQAAGTTNVTWSAQLTPAAGGGAAVAAPPDALVVSRAPIQSVSVAYTDSPV